jgi:FtsP/CotA-like multicopper oxidase with cupredoxin domain
MNRRDFVKLGAGATAFMAVGQRQGYAYATSVRVRKFIQPLRRFGTDIPVLTPDVATYPGIDYYQIEAGVYRDVLHPSLPDGTRLYGYRQANTGTYRHLGGAIVARKNKPVRIKFTCSLPSEHIIPFDRTVSEGSGGSRADRAVIHLHGARAPWVSDGGPFLWVANAANGAEVGPSVPNGWLPDANGNLTNDSLYPNNQSARFMWFHDHASGITRTNAYAGLASGYFLVDDVELGMGLPVPGDVLVFQDKVLYDPSNDPNYAAYAGPGVLGGAIKGDLWYPYIYDPAIWDLASSPLTLPVPSVVAEMFGDTMLVNGTAYPFQEVNGMKRYRILNACNARFLNLSFAVEDPRRPGEPLGEPRATNHGASLWAPVRVWQIGTEGGFLPQPILLADTVHPGKVPPTPLLLGPAERADLIVDFSAVPVGMGVILYNDAPAPFPGGSKDFDSSSGGHEVREGFSPNTRTPLLFRRVAGAGQTLPIPMPSAGTTLVPVLPTVSDLSNGGSKLNLAAGSLVAFNGANYHYLPSTQELTLNEAVDAYGRLTQLIGNLASPSTAFGSPYDGPAEQVSYGTIQVWNIYNLTADTHPMHFHLFHVMVLRRQPFRLDSAGKPVFIGRGRGPDPNETAWKETVKMNPGECTTVAVLVENPFELPEQSSGVTGNAATRTFSWRNANGALITSEPVPPSPRLLSRYGILADEYVWHCHILEHEEHDMMHALIATP